MTDTVRAVEEVARHSYGRVVARLAARTGDIAAAEDHVAAAFELALRTWPRDGVPRAPEAWLMRVAQRQHIDEWRRTSIARSAAAELSVLEHFSSSPPDADGEDIIGDERLKLLFAISHPAIDPAIHTSLMLQTVMGLDAGRIAGAYLMSPSAMGQRLVRAKNKIRDAGISFAMPQRHELATRLQPVMQAIYAAFGIAWELPAVAGDLGGDLTQEAIWLGRVLVQLLPEEPEPKGLLALMLYAHARRAARVDENGGFVPLTEQDTQLWDRVAIAEAEALLKSASLCGQPLRFQLEAAVQSVFAMPISGAPINWAAAAHLQGALQQQHPTLGGHVAHAAAVGMARSAADGLAVLQALPDERLENYQPYWAVRADLLARLGDPDARAAYSRAIGLSSRTAERAYLVAQQMKLAI